MQNNNPCCTNNLKCLRFIVLFLKADYYNNGRFAFFLFVCTKHKTTNAAHTDDIIPFEQSDNKHKIHKTRGERKAKKKKIKNIDKST
jgi:hypothetical protein